MTITIGSVVPNFEGTTMMGTTIDLYEYLDKKWGLIISHPSDFGPVCTTELSRLTQINKDLMKRGVKVIVISSKRSEKHDQWIDDVCKFSNCFVPFPRINDINGEISKKLNIIDLNEKELITSRALMVINPDKKLSAYINYPSNVGRNFFEILRLIDALQLTYEHPKIFTPADWRPGEEVLVEPGHDIQGKIVELPSGKDYMKYVKDPRQI